MNFSTSHAPRLITVVAAGALLLAACGGSDDADSTDEPAPAPAEAADTQEATDSDTGDGSEVLADNEPRDEILDSVDPDGELEDAIGGLSPETRFDIVAGQLDPEPTVEIDGSNIRLVFGGGSVDNAFMDCFLATVTALDTETVTLVYPDGEEAC